MTNTEKSRRTRERLALQIPVRVRCRETAADEWLEVTYLLDVTPFGARFMLPRPIEEGRLLHLTMPLPRLLRCFDHAEEQYRIWSLVRRVRVLPATEADALPRFEAGVAFVGQRTPASYERDPATRYEVTRADANGLWNISERTNPAKRYVAPNEPRPETRMAMPIEIVLEVFDRNGKVTAREETVTENISRRGAAVYSSLEIEHGRFVRITSRAFGVAVVAAVRGRRVGTNGITRLHLEFIDKEFPLDGVG